MYRSLLILALCGAAFGQEPTSSTEVFTPLVTNAQRASFFKLAEKLNQAAAQSYAAQLHTIQAQIETEQAKKAFDAAKAELDTLIKTLCPADSEPDLSGEEPVCKAKASTIPKSQ
jgi:hypothetical protein